LLEFAESADGGDEGLPHRDRRHDHVGGAKGVLLPDLVGQGLLPLLFVGVPRGAAVEEQLLLDEAVPVADQVVVHPLIDDEVRRGGGHVEHLRSRGPLVGEDEGADPRPRRVRRDGRAGVPGTDD
jgi:hypothetical protein